MDRGRYIDRGELQAALERKKPVTGKIRFTEGYNDAMLRIKSMVSKFPGADVVPVRRAKWIFSEAYGQLVTHKCSNCGQLMTTAEGNLMNFCPNCGAKMDLEVG